MGWLFGRKKIVPKVSFPEGRDIDENALRFPGAMSSERVINLEDLKKAAGFEKTAMADEEMKEDMPPEPKVGLFKRTLPFLRTPQPQSMRSEPLYIKIDVYQHILGEIDGLKLTLSQLSETNRHLESSEFNEENGFEQLKKSVKAMHDRLLQVDKILFKSQGD